MKQETKEQYIQLQMDYFNLTRPEAEKLAETLTDERFSQSFIMSRQDLIATAQATLNVNNFLDISVGAIDEKGAEYTEEELVDLYNQGVVSHNHNPVEHPLPVIIAEQDDPVTPEEMIREDRDSDNWHSGVL